MATYRKSELTKTRILHEAGLLFAEKGYKETTIREICANSEVSFSRVNYHFESKRDLACEIMRTTVLAIDRSIHAAVGGEMQPGLLFSVVYTRLWISAYLADERYVRFCADLAEEGAFGDLAFETYFTLFLQSNEERALGFAEEELRTDTIVFLSAMSELFKAKQERHFLRTDSQFCNIFESLMLRLLCVPKAEHAALLEKANAFAAAHPTHPEPGDATVRIK